MRKWIAAPVAALMVGASTMASAAVPPEAQDIFTEAATDFATIMGYGFTAMVAIVGGLIMLKLVKKVANRTTS